MLREESDDRLADRWAIVLRKVRAVLADRRDDPAEAPDGGRAPGTGGDPGT